VPLDVFTADDGTHGDELWITDGTAAGTVMTGGTDPAAVIEGASHRGR